LFGYVKAFHAELKMKDYDIYRGMYCSLCKTLGRRYGAGARMFLNYDLSFLALTLSAMADDCPGFVQKRCDFNPAKKCRIATRATPALDLAADACVALTYYKIKDTIADAGGKKKAAALFSLPLAGAAFHKAEKNNAVLTAKVKAYIEAQADVERERLASIDKAAEPSALLLAAVFSSGETDPAQKQVRERFGYCLGRWVYLIDACDDYFDDIKNNNYNPYALLFPKGTSPGQVREKMQGDLNQTAAEAALAFELLSLKRFEDIIENVVYDGLFHEAQTVLNRRFSDAEKPV
jgi:hypothetical protein